MQVSGERFEKFEKFQRLGSLRLPDQFISQCLVMGARIPHDNGCVSIPCLFLLTGLNKDYS